MTKRELPFFFNGTNFDFTTKKLINVVDPTNAQDAATKHYVDNAGGGLTPAGVILTPDLNANRPAFGTAGRLFIPTDWAEWYRDNGSGWDGFLPGYGRCKAWTPSSFSTTINGAQSGYSATTVNGGVVLKVANSSVEISGQFKNVPSQTNYGLQMLLSFDGSYIRNYFGAGIAITDGTKFITVNVGFNSAASNWDLIRGLRWSNSTSAGSAQQVEPIATQTIWLRMFVDNAGGAGNPNVNYATSQDGVNWDNSQGGEQIYNSILGSAATQYGYFIYGSNGYTTRANIYSLEEVTS